MTPAGRHANLAVQAADVCNRLADARQARITSTTDLVAALHTRPDGGADRLVVYYLPLLLPSILPLPVPLQRLLHVFALSVCLVAVVVAVV